MAPMLTTVRAAAVAVAAAATRVLAVVVTARAMMAWERVGGGLLASLARVLSQMEEQREASDILGLHSRCSLSRMDSIPLTQRSCIGCQDHHRRSCHPWRDSMYLRSIVAVVMTVGTAESEAAEAASPGAAGLREADRNGMR